MSVKRSPSPVKDDPVARSGPLPPDDTTTGTMRVLLETAVRQFARRGYHGVSVRDITGEVGIRPASMYAHYPSKEHLLVELMRRGHRNLLARAGEALAELGDGATPTAQLAALVRSHVAAHAEYPELARVCANDLSGLSEENLTEVLALRMDVLAQLSTVLHRGIDGGEFTIDDVFLTSMAVAGMIIRVANWYGGNEAGLEFGPVLRPDATPAVRYPTAELADHYAGLVLRLVGAA